MKTRLDKIPVNIILLLKRSVSYTRKAFLFSSIFLLYVYFINTVFDVSECHYNEIFMDKMNNKVMIRFIWHKFKLH